MRALTVLILILCSIVPAAGQTTPTPAPTPTKAKSAKTDVVVMANGDRITGEIERLFQGRLEFSTDDAGTLEIEWVKIARVQATRLLEVITEDGRRLLGSLGPATDGVISLVPAYPGAVPESFKLDQITGMVPIGAGFLAKLDGSLDTGLSYTKSGGVFQATVNSITEFRRPSFLVRVTGSAAVTQRSDDGQDDDRAATEFLYVRYRDNNWFVSGGGSLENNSSLGLLLRSQVGGGLGRRLLSTNRSNVEFGGGIVANDERAVDGGGGQNLEGRVSFRGLFYTYDRPKTNLDFSASYYPSLSNWGRQRVQIDSSLKRELFKDFFFAIDLYYTFDSEPPNADADRSDVGVVMSIGWSY